MATAAHSAADGLNIAAVAVPHWPPVSECISNKIMLPIGTQLQMANASSHP
jgi:hypothetical protein